MKRENVESVRRSFLHELVGQISVYGVQYVY